MEEAWQMWQQIRDPYGTARPTHGGGGPGLAARAHASKTN